MSFDEPAPPPVRTRSAPRRDHPPPAPRVPLGPRAGRARRSSRTPSRRPTSSPTPRASGDDAKLLDELGDVLFQVALPVAAARGARGGRPRRRRREHDREADPPPPARLRRGPRSTAPSDVRVRNWDRIKRDQEGARGPSATCPRTCRRSLTRASSSAGARGRAPGRGATRAPPAAMPGPTIGAIEPQLGELARGRRRRPARGGGADDRDDARSARLGELLIAGRRPLARLAESTLSSHCAHRPQTVSRILAEETLRPVA